MKHKVWISASYTGSTSLCGSFSILYHRSQPHRLLSLQNCLRAATQVHNWPNMGKFYCEVVTGKAVYLSAGGEHRTLVAQYFFSQPLKLQVP